MRFLWADVALAACANSVCNDRKQEPLSRVCVRSIFNPAEPDGSVALLSGTCSLFGPRAAGVYAFITSGLGGSSSSYVWVCQRLRSVPAGRPALTINKHKHFTDV